MCQYQYSQQSSTNPDFVFPVHLYSECDLDLAQFDTVVADEYFDAIFYQPLSLTIHNNVPLAFRLGIGKQTLFILAANKSKAFANQIKQRFGSVLQVSETIA